MLLRILGLLTLVAAVIGCADSNNERDAHGADLQYDVEVRWTSFGIPHVKADDWASLGYGFAYATATDAVCVIAKDVQMVNGNLSAPFGSDNGNLWRDGPGCEAQHAQRWRQQNAHDGGLRDCLDQAYRRR